MLAAGTLLLAAACGGASKTANSSSGTGQKQVPACGLLKTSDLTAVGAHAPAGVQSLARSASTALSCASLFVDGSGGLVLYVTETPGSPSALAARRRQVALEQGKTKPVPALGPGAFIASREVDFLHGRRVVTLQAGFSQQGQLQVTPKQLIALGRIAISRR